MSAGTGIRAGFRKVRHLAQQHPGPAASPRRRRDFANSIGPLRRLASMPPAPPTAAPAPAAVPAPIATFRDGVWRYLRALGANAEEADDLAQEVMAFACAATLPADAEAARALLRGVARNHWLRTRRWWQRRREREVAVAVEQLWVATADADDGEALRTRLRECLGSLQERTRRALLLHYHDGLGWNDVAARIGLRPNGTKTLVQRARQTLRTCIERSAT